jgi:hypothetical protein
MGDFSSKSEAQGAEANSAAFFGAMMLLLLAFSVAPLGETGGVNSTGGVSSALVLRAF